MSEEKIFAEDAVALMNLMFSINKAVNELHNDQEFGHKVRKMLKQFNEQRKEQK
jgi:hypothetical protein|tara:strand:+ start:1169 stop:1330 length:162 start_codon:yes stop_codon:yes gene_type:complete